MAKKQRTTFAKREKELNRIAKQQEKRLRRQAKPNPDDMPAVEGPRPSIDLTQLPPQQ